MSVNRIIRECRRRAREMGGSIEREEGRSGHPHLIVCYGELTKRITMASTPTDEEAARRNTLRDVEKAILHMRGTI